MNKVTREELGKGVVATAPKHLYAIWVCHLTCRGRSHDMCIGYGDAPHKVSRPDCAWGTWY